MTRTRPQLPAILRRTGAFVRDAVAFGPRRPRGAEVAAIFLLSLAVFLPKTSTVNFHPDEATTVGTGEAFEAYLTGDWNSRVFRGYVGVTSMPMMRYAAGFARWLSGEPAPKIMRTYNFRESRDWNRRNGFMPSHELLTVSRIPFAVMAAGAITCLAALVSLCAGRVAAAGFLVSSLTSVYFHNNLGRALAEAPLLLFSAAAALALIPPVNELFGLPPLGPRFFRWTSVAGVLAGLAINSKFNAVTGAAAAAVLFFSPLFSDGPWSLKSLRVRSFILAALLYSGAAAATVCLTNPFLFKAPIAHSKEMLAHRKQQLAAQTTGHPSSALTTPDRRFRYFRHITRHYGFVRRHEIVGIVLFVVGTVIILSGAAALVRRRPGGSSAALVLAVVGPALALPMLATPLGWDRYMLFPVAALHVAGAVSFGFLLSWLVQGLALRRKKN